MLNEIIKDCRINLHLSQEYVASFLGIKRSTYTQMELGNRKVYVDELDKLGTLFGVSSGELLDKGVVGDPTMLFASSVEKLSEEDEAEILNLMKFKEVMKGLTKY